MTKGFQINMISMCINTLRFLCCHSRDMALTGHPNNNNCVPSPTNSELGASSLLDIVPGKCGPGEIFHMRGRKMASNIFFVCFIYT